MDMKYICLLGIVLMFGTYEHYNLEKFEREYTEYKKQVDLQNTIYKNQLSDLSKQIQDQTNQINSLKQYTNENNKNNNDINNLRKEYNNIKPTSQNITNYQNKIFDNFGR